MPISANREPGCRARRGAPTGGVAGAAAGQPIEAVGAVVEGVAVVLELREWAAESMCTPMMPGKAAEPPQLSGPAPIASALPAVNVKALPALRPTLPSIPPVLPPGQEAGPSKGFVPPASVRLPLPEPGRATRPAAAGSRAAAGEPGSARTGL